MKEKPKSEFPGISEGPTGRPMRFGSPRPASDKYICWAGGGPSTPTRGPLPEEPKSKRYDKPDESNPKDRLGHLKPPVHLVPPALILHVAKAMENGAHKYGAANWRQKKVRYTVYLAAAMRHLLALEDGEDYAEDSGTHHAAHLAACCGIILDAMEGGQLLDDRPTKGPASAIIKKFTTTTTI